MAGKVVPLGKSLTSRLTPVMKKITLLIPAYNEEANLHTLHAALKDYLGQCVTIMTDGHETTVNLPDYDWEMLFVNDGSKDNTLAILHSMRAVDARVNVVNLSRNFGKENAMMAGFDFATGDAVIILDADLQDPLSAIPEMIYWWEQGYDDIYAKRRTRGKQSWLRKNLSLAYYRILQKTTKVEVLENVGDYRLIDRRMLDVLKTLRETQRYTKGLFCWVGYNKKEVLIDRLDRAGGKSSFKIRSLVNLALEGITSYTVAPLRLATILGLVISALSMVMVVKIFLKTMIYGETVQGFPTLACCVLLLGGVQLITIGVIGEYVGRIFNETKGRPVYIAESYNGKRL